MHKYKSVNIIRQNFTLETLYVLCRRNKSLPKDFINKLITVYWNSSVMIHSECVAVNVRDQRICAIDPSRCAVRRSLVWTIIDRQRQLRFWAISKNDFQKNRQMSKIMHFRWSNVFDDTCRMGRWSFRCWFNLNRSTFDEDVREKTIFTLSLPVTLTFHHSLT